jgi:hypothetical protein
MKKRFVALMLVIVMGVVLTACGSANSDKNLGQNNNPGANSGTNNNPDQGEDSNTGADGEGQEGTNTDDGAGNDNGAELAKSTQAMVDAILAKVEQPSLMDVTSDMLQDLYHLDPALLEQFTIKMPMMNVKTNEIAILKVKDANDIAAVEEAVKQRAEDVQKQFETYLQDQYENAKNYKIVVKENYLLFVISESADTIVIEFNSLFE